MDAETRAYLDEMREDFRGVRGEVGDLRRDVGDLRGEVSGLHGEVGGLRSEVTDLRGEVGNLREEMRTEAATTRRHFDVVAESLRSDIKGVAEGVIDNTRAIDHLRGEIYREMDERFRVVHLAFADLRRHIVD